MVFTIKLRSGKGAVRGILTAFAAFFSVFFGYKGGHRYRYVGKRLIADRYGGYYMQVISPDSARAEPGRHLSSGKTGNEVQEGYFSRNFTGRGYYSGDGNEWKDNDSRNVGARNGRGGQSASM